LRWIDRKKSKDTLYARVMLRLDSPPQPKAKKNGLFRHFLPWGVSRNSEGQETVGRWGGKLAAVLGLSGPVDKASFDKLCDDIDPRPDDAGRPQTAGWCPPMPGNCGMASW
jgi:hypothetical protein